MPPAARRFFFPERVLLFTLDAGHGLVDQLLQLAGCLASFEHSTGGDLGLGGSHGGYHRGELAEGAVHFFLLAFGLRLLAFTAAPIAPIADLGDSAGLKLPAGFSPSRWIIVNA